MAAVVCLFWQTARGDGPIGAKELKKFLSLDRSQKIMIKPKVKAKIFEGKSEVNVETVGLIQSNHLRLKLKRGTGCLKGNIPHTNAGGFDASRACQEIKKNVSYHALRRSMVLKINMQCHGNSSAGSIV